MADTTTSVYQFVLPEVGASDDTWGDKLNADLTKLEALLVSGFTGGTPTDIGKLKSSVLPSTVEMTSAAPQLRFSETDFTDPEGRWRFLLDVDRFYLQRSTGAGWTATETAWRADAATKLVEFSGYSISFANKVGASATDLSKHLMMHVNGYGLNVTTAPSRMNYVVPSNANHDFYIGANLIANLNTVGFEISAVAPRIVFNETDQTDPAGRWRTIVESDAFQLQRATTAGGWSTVEAALLARGATKSLDVGPTYTFRSGVSHFSSTIGTGYQTVIGNGSTHLLLKETTGATGSGVQFRTDASTFYLMLTDSGDADGGFNALRPFYVTKATGLVSMGNGLSISNATAGVAFGPGLAANAQDNSKHILLHANGHGINVAAGRLNINGGTATQIDIYLGTNLVGTFSPAGTASPVATTIITREKGDLRYAAASSERYKDGIEDADEAALAKAFDALRLRRWTWGGDLPEEDERHGTPGVGFVVEELDLPEAVRHRWVEEAGGETRPNAVAVDALCAALAAKIRTLQARLDAAGI